MEVREQLKREYDFLIDLGLSFALKRRAVFLGKEFICNGLLIGGLNRLEANFLADKAVLVWDKWRYEPICGG